MTRYIVGPDYQADACRFGCISAFLSVGFVSTGGTSTGGVVAVCVFRQNRFGDYVLTREARLAPGAKLYCYFPRACCV